MIIKAKDITSLPNGNGKDHKIQRYRVERIFNLLKILKKQKQKKRAARLFYTLDLE